MSGLDYPQFLDPLLSSSFPPVLQQVKGSLDARPRSCPAGTRAAPALLHILQHK